MESIEKKLQHKSISDIVISKVSDYGLIVSKSPGVNFYAFTLEVVEALKKTFKSVKPWSHENVMFSREAWIKITGFHPSLD